MNILLLGAPGVGKGTQARMLSDRLKLPQIATGDLLRDILKQADHPLSASLQKTMQDGKLVEDATIIQIFLQRVAQSDCTAGYLLDGFPRTLAQAKKLHHEAVKLDYIIEIVVPEEAIVERMSGRLIHPDSGRIYHTQYHPPKQPGIDDLTGEPLVIRPDDQEDTVRHRLAVYRDNTYPLIDYYKGLIADRDNSVGQLIQIDGMQPIDSVHKAILASMSISGS